MPRALRGRPPGSLKPLTRWLHSVIGEMRRDGFGQAETWRRLCLVEDAAEDGSFFTVTDETADACWQEVGVDLAGQRVTWPGFRSTWRRLNF